MGYSLLSQDYFAAVATHTLGQRNTRHLNLPARKLQSLFKSMIILGLHRAMGRECERSCGLWNVASVCCVHLGLFSEL